MALIPDHSVLLVATLQMNTAPVPAGTRKNCKSHLTFLPVSFSAVFVGRRCPQSPLRSAPGRGAVRCLCYREHGPPGLRTCCQGS